MNLSIISKLIAERRSVYPNMYIDQPIEKAVIEQILENANWAPTHRMTEPWRFKVFQGEKLKQLSEYLGNYYKENTPPETFREMKFKKTVKKPLQSGAVIAICMQRDPDQSVPEEEEIASVAMAVQNMWLSCAAHGIGAYWSSPASAYNADEFLGLQPGDRCLGWFYMGYYEAAPLPGKRSPISDKVDWL